MAIRSLEPHLRKLFRWYGPFVYRYRWPMLLLPLVLTGCLCGGLIRLEELTVGDPTYVFTPTDARWRTEYGTFADLWPLRQEKFMAGKTFEYKRYINILVGCKDDGNILRPHILAEIDAMNQAIEHNVSVPTTDGQFTLTYQDLCLNYDWVCHDNGHIRMLEDRDKIGKYIDLSFPKGGKDDTPVYLGTSLADVVLNETDHTVLSAKMTQLFYFLRQEPKELYDYSTKFLYAIEHYVNTYKSDNIHLALCHVQSLEDGLNENASRFTPNFVVSMVMLTVFSVLCSLTLNPRTWRVDWLRSKPFLAIAGLINALLSILSSFGLLLCIGIPFNVINTIIPFLILAVGVDDMFIMMSCWERSDRTLSVQRRMADTLSHAAVAITITSLTDVLSFGVGCITDLPGIYLFCSYACVAITFCYLYQLTFFAGAMAIMGSAEHKGRHCMLLVKLKEPEKVPPPPSMPHTPPTITTKSGKKLARLPSNANEARGEDPSLICIIFRKYFGPFLLKPVTKTIVAIIFVAYIAGAIAGCLNFREGLEASNLVTGDHYVAKYFHLVKKFWAYGLQFHVAVGSPPNFTDPSQRERLMAMVRSFEDTEYTTGREGTMFFFLEYIHYLDDLGAGLENTHALWSVKLKRWLEFTGGSSQWEQDVVWPDGGQLQAFRFQVAMKKMLSTNDHKLSTILFREVADSFPDLNVTVYHEGFPFADQYLIILSAALRSVGIALICMILVSLALIPSVPCGFLILASIVSIDLGVFGYMTMWGVNLDAVSMISIIMSIGFAVDLSAHICYAYVTALGTADERALEALETLGWPIFQGAFSTIVGISVLGSVDAYIIRTFWKTIWLEMIFGLAHGLVFLPVALTFVMPSAIHGNHDEDIVLNGELAMVGGGVIFPAPVANATVTANCQRHCHQQKSRCCNLKLHSAATHCTQQLQLSDSKCSSSASSSNATTVSSPLSTGLSNSSTCAQSANGDQTPSAGSVTGSELLNGGDAECSAATTTTTAAPTTPPTSSSKTTTTTANGQAKKKLQRAKKTTIIVTGPT